VLIHSNNETCFAGPLDAILILRHAATGRYHVAFFEEQPPPGPRQAVDDVQVVRLKSRMHHTAGSDTLEGAGVHVDELNWRRDPAWRAEDAAPASENSRLVAETSRQPGSSPRMEHEKDDTELRFSLLELD
jgi:hypothetical protein